MLRALWRLPLLLAHLVRGLWLVWWRFDRLSQQGQHALMRSWSQQLLTLLGVALEVRGDSATAGPLLLVSNHISWLDITVIHAARHCRFVSKGDVKHWPLVGALAQGIGTLFIERESRRDALRVVHEMAHSLAEGDVLAVFPEGTTSCGASLLPFHANLLQAAISAQAPVQPLALQYLDRVTRQASRVPAYVGDDHLLGSIWRILCARDLLVIVSFGVPQGAAGRERRAWAADLRDAISLLRA